MADNGKSILTRIKNSKDISEKLINLIYIKEVLSTTDLTFLYSFALLLINEYEENKTKHLFLDYAYYIIARTSLKSNNYMALYDFATNYGYYPISRKISELKLIETPTINQWLAEIGIDDFVSENKVLTLEQSKIFLEVLNDNENFTSFLAPTSYGKSEIIFEHIKKHNTENVIAIITPTKALIDQVSRDARKRITDRKIITHDQNYSNDDSRILAIVTQERALRLIDEGAIFDRLYIDEAHEIFPFDFGKKQSNRSLLLSRLMNITLLQNPNCKYMYLSPVINKAQNISFLENQTIKQHKIFNDLKLLNIKYITQDYVHQYDLYLGEFIKLGAVKDQFEYIKINSKDRNLHFLYRPIQIEQYTEKLYDSLETNISIPDDIKELIQELKMIVHEDFKMVNFLNKGIVYLHAKIPSLIKNYILKFVRESNYIKHFVANSVVLSGMNMPIDNLFYISGYSKLVDLKNLFGRVNRLNEIFSPQNKDLSRILIPINFVDIPDFPQPHGKLKNKVEKLRSNFDDEIKNPLLENSKIDPNNQNNADEIKNTEKQIIENYTNPKFKEKLTLAGAQQILNYTPEGLTKLEKKFNLFIQTEDDDIFNLIKIIFFDDFSEHVDFNPEYNAYRLRNTETITYYKMFVDDFRTRTLNDRINKTVNYWEKKESGYKIYVGGSYGEEVFDSIHYPKSFNKVYVNLTAHKDDRYFLNNLAIVKLQIDEEYVSHEISLLVNTLLKFEIISQSDYDKFFYGTSDSKELEILQLGISRTLFNKLKEDGQLDNIFLDDYGNAKASENLKEYIGNQKGIEKFELEQYFL